MITTDTGAKKIEGTDNWRGIFDAHNDSVDAYDGVVARRGDLSIVVDGDTHVAINKGQYVDVKNHSTLADGIYYAKENILVTDALSTANLAAADSGALNALKAEVDALNSKITNIPNNVNSSYNVLMLDTDLTTTTTVYNTYNSRKFSDYVILFFTIIVGDYIRENVIIPRHVFVSRPGTGTSLNYTNGGVNVEVVITYNTDTSVRMKYNASSTRNVIVRIDALALENKA